MSADDARIERFAALKARFPDREQPRWTLATALAEGGRLAEAATEFQELVEIKPDFCVAWLHLGSTLLELDRARDAVTALEKARDLAIDQDHTAPRLEAEQLLEEALEELE